MLNVTRSDYAEFERTLAWSMEPVASDIRLLELQHLVGARDAARMAHVEGLVNSSIELYFKPGTLLFSNAMEFELDWGRNSSVVFEMEFHHLGVHAYFRLLLKHRSAGVELSYLHFESPTVDDADKGRRLGNALRSARGEHACRQRSATLGSLAAPPDKKPPRGKLAGRHR